MADSRQRKSLAIDDDLHVWIDYASGMAGQSSTAYINAAIRREMEAAEGENLAAFEAFKRARASRAEE